ncbi:MAG: hypothetical protein HC835_10730 [Oscillatoriales cyanobacterium RM2_1_1]|nr:hypothetical protein [Oscillatoriales cyanobacterium SM2_3_0]NJO46056.1 hypothetical protein [Oscillatoriales cyanobacterium RM2_1_1]
MDLFPNGDRNPWNGNQSDPLDPLNSYRRSDGQNQTEDLDLQPYDSETSKKIRRSFIFLVVIGLLVGVLVAAGVIYVLDRFDVKAVPEPVESVQ